MPKRPRSILTTLLFTDIVGSTRLAEEMGDRRWRELLARHHRFIRIELKRHGGHELDTAGDGFFARFDTPASAIRCGCAVSDAVRGLGIELRVGIHIGECEILDGKVSGVNVHIAARVMGEARAGEVLVTGGVRDLVTGAGLDFDDRGMHELKGVDGERHLFEVTGVDDTPRAAALPDEEGRARRDKVQPPALVNRRGVRVTTAIIAVTLLVVGTTIAAVRWWDHPTAGAISACQVTIDAPLNDHGFNQAVFDGLTDAATEWGTSVRDKVSRPYSPRVWTTHIREFLNQRCSMIVTMFDQMADVTVPIAMAHPTQRFVVVDATRQDPPIPNVLTVDFRADEAAFEAGYLAAGMSSSGRVGTFGGVPIDGVTAYMDGLAAGIRYYNRTNGSRIRLDGWDPRTQSGRFVSRDTNNVGAFADFDQARHIAAELIADGADIVMPVDGTVGNEAAGAAAERAGGVLLIGVDQDQHFATPAYADIWLTSVLKNYRVMVHAAMGEIVHGDFTGGVLTGTLENGGVSLAPFYGFDRTIPVELQAELQDIETQIMNGTLSVSPGSYR
jgi:basic membrane protein A and related proteins